MGWLIGDDEMDNQNQYGDEDYFDEDEERNVNEDDIDEGDISEYDDEYDDVPDYFEEDVDG